jgi:iron complex outermembrane receptor protein
MSIQPSSRQVLAAAITALATSTPLWAQPMLEEVIVTAQKREQSLQDAPIAITAFSESDIQTRGIRNVQDISMFVPNVQVAPNPAGATSATFAIRGSTTINPAITWESTVAMYLDGVFIGKNLGGIFDVAELARVEVLRGPQGTLYGKNTVGGAINLVTREPGEAFDGYVEVSAGNENYVGVRGRIDTGRMGAVRASVSFSDRARDGFYDNIDFLENPALDPAGGFNPYTGPASTSEFASWDSTALRLDVIADVSETLTARYNYNQSKIDNAPNMGQVTNVDAFVYENVFMSPDLVPVHELYLEPGNNRADGISNDFAGFDRSDTSGHSLTLTWDLGDLTVKSVTAKRDLEWADALDIDGTPMDLFHSARYVDYDQFSQELQLVGTSGAMNYVAGLYYFTEEGDVFNPISFFSFGGFGLPTDDNEYGIDNKSWAVYGQVDFTPDAMPELTLTAGLRYTDEEKTQSIYHPNTSTFGAAPAFDLKESDSWSNTTGTFIASYALNDDSSIYAKVSQGWKAGGFNGEAPTADAFLDNFDPEEVLAYEAGFKSRLMNNRVELNAAVFYNDISDMQFSIFLEGSGGAASTVDNAGAATIKGFEVELTAQLSDGLRLSANYGYLDAKYDEFIDVDLFTGEYRDFKNERDFPYAPEATGSLALDWRVGELGIGVLDAHFDWSFKDDYVVYTDPTQNATGSVDSYEIANARLSLSDIQLGDNATLEVSAWGKNIFDEEYVENTIPFGAWTISYWGYPATYGVDARINF